METAALPGPLRLTRGERDEQAIIPGIVLCDVDGRLK